MNYYDFKSVLAVACGFLAITILFDLYNSAEPNLNPPPSLSPPSSPSIPHPQPGVKNGVKVDTKFSFFRKLKLNKVQNREDIGPQICTNQFSLDKDINMSI